MATACVTIRSSADTAKTWWTCMKVFPDSFIDSFGNAGVTMAKKEEA